MDFLFEDEWEEFLAEGTLTRLVTAFSREQETKCYVQHKLRESGAEVTDLIIKHDCDIFVCGDLSMTKMVYATVVRLLIDFGNMTQTDAEAYVHKMSQQKRLVQDVWG